MQVLDDKNVRRRFRASNYQSTTRVKPFICTMPMRLDDGWNQIQFNLSDFTRRAYGTNYIETLRVQVNIATWQLSWYSTFLPLLDPVNFYIFPQLWSRTHEMCILTLFSKILNMKDIILLIMDARVTRYIFTSSSFQIHANCRIRRVYFSDRLYSEDELPAEFKLYLPVQNKK